MINESLFGFCDGFWAALLHSSGFVLLVTIGYLSLRWGFGNAASLMSAVTIRFWWQEQKTLGYSNQCDAWTPQLRQLQWGVFYEAATLRYSIAARVSFLYCEELQRLCGNQYITVSAVTTFGFFQLQWRHFWFTVSCCVLGSTTSVVATGEV